MNNTFKISLEDQIGAVNRSIEILKETVGIFDGDLEASQASLLELNRMYAVRESLKTLLVRSQSVAQSNSTQITSSKGYVHRSFDLDRIAQVQDVMVAIGLVMYGGLTGIIAQDASLDGGVGMRGIAEETLADAQKLIASLDIKTQITRRPHKHNVREDIRQGLTAVNAPHSAA